MDKCKICLSFVKGGKGFEEFLYNRCFTGDAFAFTNAGRRSLGKNQAKSPGRSPGKNTGNNSGRNSERSPVRLFNLSGSFTTIQGNKSVKLWLGGLWLLIPLLF